MPKATPGKSPSPCGRKTHILANEFASYRQALAIAIRDLRPHVEVFETSSESLDGEVSRSALTW